MAFPENMETDSSFKCYRRGPARKLAYMNKQINELFINNFGVDYDKHQGMKTRNSKLGQEMKDKCKVAD